MDSLSRYETVFQDAKTYNPERFLDAEGKFTQSENFAPFGMGRRACPAEAMARMELYLFLSALIQRFELRPEVPGEPPSLEPIPGITYNPQPCRIRFVDRRGL
ncbi:cytochrome P450 2J2-like [Elysia marginata]|uniref:Cytochrome P450 2J2-like n=1 Tax=Elysia marginata TaxID=1093978 RepID=A0AAV4HUX9_9GAST|nr:cytochrome P450 2J2-like [Elysia marginata]